MVKLEWLLEQGPCKEFKAQELIPCGVASVGKGGSPENKAMYILLSGSVDVFGKSAAGGMKKVSSVIKGDVFGGREYFLGADEYLYRAAEDSTVYLLTEESFNDLSWSQPDILFEILHSAYTPPRPPISTAPAAKPTVAATPKPTASPASTTPAAAVPAKAAPGAAKTEPVIDRAAVQAKVAAQAQAAVAVKEVSATYLPGHKQYTDKEFTMNEKLVFQKEYTCPFCKRNFSDFRVFRSKLYESRPMRFDLRKFFNDFTTEWYDVITCHHCYFTAFHNYFTDPKPIKKDAIEVKLTAARADMRIDFNAARNINTVFTMHYLALICCDGYPSLAKQLRAKLWGNLSWLYEDVEDKDLEKAAAEKAADAYEEVFSTTRLTPVQEQITCLSIAGMQRRAGIDKNLKRYVFTAKTHEMGDKTYAKLADDFLYELKLQDEEIEPIKK